MRTGDDRRRPSQASEAEREAAMRSRPVSTVTPGGTRSFMVLGNRFNVRDRYKLIRVLGFGAFGVVCAADDTWTRTQVAIKKISNAFSNLIHTKRILREVRLMRYFCHDNIIKILDLMRPTGDVADADDIYIVTELMETDLHQIIVSPQKLTIEHVQYFLYQILRGLRCIHSAGVLHRDLKPSNLLLNSNCDLKIADFGLARMASAEDDTNAFMTEYVATRWYRAPEIMLSWKEYSKAIDMWSVGCIFAELLGRRPLFQGRDYMHQLHLITDVLGTPSFADTEYIASPKAKEYIRSLPIKPRIPLQSLYPGAPADALDLLQKMLMFSPEKRISVDEALTHPFLASLHDPTDEPTASGAFDFSFESVDLDVDTLRDLLWNEAEQYEKSDPAGHVDASITPMSY
ncbi:unnamed protein product (mitochondrion) [Plasmodiophora brassicae]|uniref:Mitogen-activated protein kinase n=2 Tax=Plasmodiophora brassicae TaxID=37360 RepID=A0A2L2BM68_PLABS|nr:MAPK3 [Plasmodiophora brassicae]SPQ93705.1 unnamed protein product [Plasmodiophora brassicae]